ncbi:MAG: hypothetical protein AB1568_07700 [Thermodesulfobacteriota bacterium]
MPIPPGTTTVPTDTDSQQCNVWPGTICLCLLSLVLLFGSEISFAASAAFRFSGRVTAVAANAPDFPAAYGEVAVGDTVAGTISYHGSAAINPFGVLEGSTAYFFHAAAVRFTGRIGNQPFTFSDRGLLLSVWNDVAQTLSVQPTCAPAATSHDGFLIWPAAASLDAPTLFIGNYCLPHTSFADATLPRASIPGTAFFSLGPFDLSAQWIGGTIDSILYAPSPGWPVTSRVSLDAAAGEGNDDSSWPAISADGRWVAFHSRAANLVAGDGNNTEDVFVHDRRTGRTSRASVGAGGREGNNGSRYPALSADGRFVAFESAADNLVDGDSNGVADVFVHDLQTATTRRVSVDSGGQEGNGGSQMPAISSDGRYVAFQSGANNLVGDDTNTATDIFVHDLQTGRTTRVSVDSGGGGANGPCRFASLSGNGRFVAFSSSATNLVPGDTNAEPDVFVHDSETGRTSRVNVDANGTQGNERFPLGRSSLSRQGRYVAFDSGADNLVAGDTNGTSDIFVHDLQTGRISRVSVDSRGGQSDGYSYAPSISTDGRYVAFMSDATNLVPHDANQKPDVQLHGRSDIYLHDRRTGRTSRVSVDSDGGLSSGTGVSSYSPSLSADGRWVAFSSDGNGLVEGDGNGFFDVFIHGSPVVSGDLNGTGTVDLADAIIAAQALAGMDIAPDSTLDGESGGDGRIGADDTILILQSLSWEDGR